MGQIQHTMTSGAALHPVQDRFYIGDNPQFKFTNRGLVKTRPGVPFVRVDKVAKDTFKPHHNLRKARHAVESGMRCNAYT